jgi:hypothetical protein
MVVFVVAMVIGGLCVVGYWQTYDIKCGAFGNGNRTWTWTQLPPKFKCANGF